MALDAIMDFVKLGKDGKFQSAIYHRLLHSIVSFIFCSVIHYFGRIMAVLNILKLGGIQLFYWNE